MIDNIGNDRIDVTEQPELADIACDQLATQCKFPAKANPEALSTTIQVNYEFSNKDFKRILGKFLLGGMAFCTVALCILSCIMCNQARKIWALSKAMQLEKKTDKPLLPDT